MLGYLESNEELRWQLHLAYRDVDSLLTDVGSLLTDSDRRLHEVEGNLDDCTRPNVNSTLRDWRRKLWEFKVEDEQDHLFGSYMLGCCHQSVDTGSAAESLRSHLIRRLSQDDGSLIAIIQQTAEFLLMTDPPASSPTTTSVDVTREAEANNTPIGTDARNEGGGQVTSKRWYHKEPPSHTEYPHGPLLGNQKTMADIICQNIKGGKDRRALKRLGEDGAIWIVQISPQRLEVYFRDDYLWPASNSSYLEKLKKDKDELEKHKKEQNRAI
jgi:hypothetical protein